MVGLSRNTLKGPVFYIAGEGYAGLGRRLKALEINSGQTLANAPFFISKTSAELMNEKSANTVASEIKTLCFKHGPPRLIVIDTFARNMGDGDENSNADVGVFINRIDNMRAELGCAVLLVHHSGHGAIDRARGASSLHAAMDTVFRLDKTASGMTMVHVKAKESELNAPLPLALEQITLAGWLDANGDEMNSAVVVAGTPLPNIGPAKLSHKQKQALDIFLEAAKAFGELSTDGKLAGLHVETWRREYYAKFPENAQGTNKTAFARAQKALVEAGRLAISEHDFYHLSGITRLTDNTQIVKAIKTRNEAAQGT